MWDRIRVSRSQSSWPGKGKSLWPERRPSRQPTVEVLEGRQLLASLQPITSLTVPTTQGETIPLLAASGFTDAQTFTVTSSNPDIVASIVNGKFWSIGVSDPTDDISGTLVSQLFDSTTVNGKTENLTPNTVTQISNFTTGDYYTSGTVPPPPPLTGTNPTSKTFTRVMGGFPTATDFVIQGGGANYYGTGTPVYPNGQTISDYDNENLQQLAFTGTDQLALANAGINTNNTQFFFTTGSPNAALGYNYTIFGQLVSGQTTLAQMAAVPVVLNGATGETSLPKNTISITSASLSTTNPNGVLLLDATQATTGEMATITVTATDSVDQSTTSQTFTVTVGSYTGPTSSSLIQTINFKPFATAQTATTQLETPESIQLQGKTGSPVSSSPGTLSYSLVTQPAHGTITNFNASTGTLTYTPDKNYLGPDSFQYSVTATGSPSTTAPSATSNPATVSVTVTPALTGAVTMVGPVLIVTPLPRTDHGTNTIEVAQIPNPSGTGGIIQVTVNGVLDATQPPTSGTGAASEVIVFGGRKAQNYVRVEPQVTIPVTISGGQGTRNALVGGGAESREHGWFGFTTLIGGPGPNQLIGRAGHVRFRPSTATNLIFAGVPRRRTAQLHPVPPGGTFYKFVHGHLVPVPTPEPPRYPKPIKLP